MPQHRLEHYFGSSRERPVSSGTNFLTLPFNVRRLVYEHVAIDYELVDLNYNNLIVYPYGEYPQTRGCRKLDFVPCFKLRRNNDVVCQEEVWEMNPEEDEDDYGRSIWNRPWGAVQSMLLVSKEIHRQMEAYVYSAIIFRICLGRPLGLSRLWRLSENALSHIRTLTIRLDQPVSETTYDSWDCPPRQIDVTKKSGKQIVRDWMRTLDILGRTLAPHTLSLNLIFRARAMDDARAILEPMEGLPLLKNLGIHAERHGRSLFWKTEQMFYDRAFWSTTRPVSNQSELSLLVQHTIRKLATVDRNVSTPFRFLDLPQEIRITILGYTNLISPDAVQWRPRAKLRRDAPCQYCEGLGVRFMLNGIGACCCDPYRASSFELETKTERICCEECAHSDGSRICYCSHRSPAWSSSCTCLQRLRQTLFWVSRQMRWDAQTVYYNSNKIVVTSYNSQLFRQLYIDDNHEWADSRGFGSIPKVELSL